MHSRFTNSILYFDLNFNQIRRKSRGIIWSEVAIFPAKITNWAPACCNYCSAKTTGSALSRRKISAPSIQNLLPFHQLATHWSISISLVVKSGGSISNSKWRCAATQALNMKPPIPETLLKNGTWIGGWTRTWRLNQQDYLSSLIYANDLEASIYNYLNTPTGERIIVDSRGDHRWKRI